MRYQAIERRLPPFLRRHFLHFEFEIERSVKEFARSLASTAKILDAGAGERVHAPYFERCRYVGIDLAIGDKTWDYGKLDAVADLTAIPFADGTFDACINIVTLEHVREPGQALREMQRTLRPGGRLLLIVPHEWEVHQSPHDFFRYTRHGVSYLLDKAGFADYSIEPVGGYFRLCARRMLNGLQFFRGLWFPIAAIFLVPPALVLPWFDSLDRDRNFTLGYVCIAKKPG